MSRRYISGSRRGKGGTESWIPEHYYQRQTSKYGYYKPEKLRRGVTRYSWVEDKRDEIPVAAPAAPPPPPTAKATPEPAFEKRLQTIQSTNKSNTDALMKQMAADRKSYEDMAAKQAASIKSYQNAFNQGSSVGGEDTALMINPAQSVATKKKRTSKGTQQFNRNLKISNVSI